MLPVKLIFALLGFMAVAAWAQMVPFGHFKQQRVQVFSASGTWIVPGDWNDGNNSLECIGAGGDGFDGNGSDGGSGGGGGAYAKASNHINPDPGNTLTITIGAGGAGSGGLSKVENGGTKLVEALGGTVATLAAGGAGGIGASGTGGTLYSGGTGGSQAAAAGSSGGGGAAGPAGVGRAGGGTSPGGGGGGGGNGNGSVGNSTGTDTGATGGNNAAGVGGGAIASAGVSGGGGGGSTRGAGASGGAGGNGVDILEKIGGGGGGGGGGRDGVNGGAGGLYGGGGGGTGRANTGSPGQGAGGVCVIRYAPNGPPAFIQEAETTWTVSSTSLVTAAFNVKDGDILVAYAAAESDNVLGTVTGGSLTWTLDEEINVTDYSHVKVWTATVDVDKSMTVTFNGANMNGGNVLTFRRSSGIGSSSQITNASGAPSLNITTTLANSAVVVVNADWSALDGATRTWLNSLTELTYARSAANYTVYGGYHANIGAVGTYSVGLSVPGAQKYSIIAVEVKGLP